METPRTYLRLYAHALESIFSHLNLSELAHISATCRDWSSAVNSMRPIGACAGRRKNHVELQSIRNSRLVRHVSELYLAGKLVSVSGISVLCDIIKQSKSLAKVDLSDNRIGDECVSIIAEAIKQSTSLAAVDLCGNGIGAVGASAIAEAINQSTSLTSLSISQNSIGVVGASAIAEAIKQSKSLTWINLWGNSIGAVGASAIAEAIEQNKSNVKMMFG